MFNVSLTYNIYTYTKKFSGQSCYNMTIGVKSAIDSVDMVYFRLFSSKA